MIFSLLLKDFSHWDIPDLYRAPTTKHSLLCSSIAGSDFAKLCIPISSVPFVIGDGIATPYQRDVSLLGMNTPASCCFLETLFISKSCVTSLSLRFRNWGTSHSMWSLVSPPLLCLLQPLITSRAIYSIVRPFLIFSDPVSLYILVDTFLSMLHVHSLSRKWAALGLSWRLLLPPQLLN